MSIVAAPLVPESFRFQTAHQALCSQFAKAGSEKSLNCPTQRAALSHIAHSPDGRTERTVSKSECLLTFTHTEQKPITSATILHFRIICDEQNQIMCPGNYFYTVAFFSVPRIKFFNLCQNFPTGTEGAR